MLYTHDTIQAGRSQKVPAGLPHISPDIAVTKAQLPITLRAAIASDLNALETVERRAFTYNRIPRRGFARFISSPHATLIVAYQNNLCLGYAIVLFRSRSQISRLYSIGVDPVCVRRGVGSNLLSAAEEAARSRSSEAVRLEVDHDNRPAMDLYCKFGYRIIGRYSCYYDNGNDALRLDKRLGSGLIV
jgi:ribosomal protein S18 acetylase RimI-like enzyme